VEAWNSMVEGIIETVSEGRHGVNRDEPGATPLKPQNGGGHHTP
jgi:hypothetical protein